MKPELFNPKVRDKAIETACSNLLMSGVLLPEDIAGYMSQITGLNNYDLAEQLVATRLLLDNYYEANARTRRN